MCHFVGCLLQNQALQQELACELVHVARWVRRMLYAFKVICGFNYL